MIKNMKYTILNILFMLSSVCAQAQTYVTVYTKFGNPIEGVIRTEMTDAEKNEALEWVETYFPEATVLSEPSRLYNCHSYAWNMQDGGAICWINAVKSDGQNNLNVYFGNREYYVPTTEDKAVKIHYYNGDHSAIPSPTSAGKYISKWGELPLMLHNPDYCPYLSGRNYYCKRIFNNNKLECSVEGRGVHVNETANYYITDDVNTPWGYSLEYRWSITDYDDEDIIGTIATITDNGNNANISFNNSGLYMITCEVYTREGELIATYRMQGVVEY